MQTTRTIADIRKVGKAGPSAAFVPTMGALHEGHIALIRRAKELSDRVVVSIFVNPTQFSAGEDLDQYPRTEPADLAVCEREGVDLVFLPGVDEMYPPDEPEWKIEFPGLTDILEGAHRPGHFSGVCRAVTKLFNSVQPSIACFGLKDYQQLCVIRALVSAMAMSVNIEACPTVREEDGLALSSRNMHLGDEERNHALGLYKSLQMAESMIKEGESDPNVVQSAMVHVLTAHKVELDYAEIRDAHTLKSVQSINPKVEPVVCLVAGRVGDVRLIDNVVMDR